MKTPHHLTPNSLAAQRLASERVERASSARIQQIAEEVAQNERRRAVADATSAKAYQIPPLMVRELDELRARVKDAEYKATQTQRVLDRLGATHIYTEPCEKDFRIEFRCNRFMALQLENPSAYLKHVAQQMIAVLAQNLARCDGPAAREIASEHLAAYGADVFHQELRHQLRQAIGGPATTDALDIMWRMVKNEFQRRGLAVPA